MRWILGIIAAYILIGIVLSLIMERHINLAVVMQWPVVVIWLFKGTA